MDRRAYLFVKGLQILRKNSAAGLASLLLLCSGFSSGQAADVPLRWVQFAADGSLSARFATAPGAACPSVTADDRTIAAQPRGAPDQRFPLQLCEASVPAATSHLTADGSALATVAKDPRRLVIIGDTGCRIEGRAVQDCNDPKSWPFAAVAAKAAARRPDLVIHVGDYYYRESACPGDRAGCTGSPWGDNWDAWRADFFAPAAPLLAAAPWVMVRGNHELCRRGGQGWTQLLDPHPNGGCTDTSPPYRLGIGGLNLLVFDSADADDFKEDTAKVPVFAGQMANVLDGAPPHAWLVTHKPVWAMAQGQLVGLTSNLTEQAAIRNHVPSGLDMVLAGHLHDFLVYNFGPQRPAQLVVGTGGDNLLELGKSQIVGAEIDGERVSSGFAMKAFGYFVLDRVTDGWDGVFYDPDDQILARCALRGRDISCR